MEESVEVSKKLKAKSPMAISEAAGDDAVLNNITNSQRSREEGELSSYDDDDFRAMSSSPQVTSVYAAQLETVQSVPANKSTQDIKADNIGKSDTSNNFVRDVPSRSTLQPNHNKSNEKNRGPFVPFVISFSDDDSGSDSEQNRQKMRVLNEGRNIGANRSKRPPETSLPNPQKLQQTRCEAQMVPKKVSLSRPVVSSMTRISGPNSQTGGPYPSSRNSNTKNRVVDHDHGRKTGVHLNTNKLQDLRQLIAIRESELKLKSAKQTKTSASHRDYSLTNLSNEKARGRRAASLDNVESVAKEPKKKRPRISEPQSHQLFAARHREVPKRQSLLESEKPNLPNIDQHKAEDLRKEVPLHASQSGFAAESQDPSSSTDLLNGVNHGTGVEKSRQIDRNNKIANPVPSSECVQTANEVAKDISREKNNVTSESYLTQRSDQHQNQSKDKTLQRTADDAYQERSLQPPDNNLRITDASLNSPSFWNRICTGSSDMEAQALLDLEDSHDKELEKAQEHRRKCEVEERNARDAYRKSQRALAEANARCSYLYSKREIYSAQLRSLMMENSSLFWSFGPNDQSGSRLNPSNNFSNFNVQLIPTSSDQVQAQNDASGSHGFDTNMHSANDMHQNIQDLHVSGQNVASDPASEHDEDLSEPQKEDGVENGVYCPDDNSTMSGDEEGETFRTSENGLKYERKDESNGVAEKEINDGSVRQEQLDTAQESLLLEASLRSQLFERLQMNALIRKRDQNQVEPLDERIDNDNGGGQVECDSLEMLPSGGDKDEQSDLPGHESTSFSTLSCPILRSALRHVNITVPTSLVQSQISSPDMQLFNVADENGDEHPLSENKPCDSSWSLTEATLMDLSTGHIGSYSCNLSIDPFWPLCMYELRGKCNNDECPWQHVKNYSFNDCQVTPSEGKYDSATALSKSMDCLVSNPPTYLVDLDALQGNFWPYKSILTKGYGQCWKKCFSASLVLSSLLPTDLNRNEPFLHGSEPRIEVHASWNRQLSSFPSRNGTLKQADQYISDKDQALELALLNLSCEANKQKGRLEALKVLARAVEADPTSAVLWIVYLQIYYSNQKSIGKDDMFRCAVEHNESSYELWLMYINSRTHLDNHVVAYDEALSVLCRQASGPVQNAMHASGCILDIFLQMINCLCMSGNLVKAIEKIYGLFPSTKGSDELNQLFLTDIITCFTIYDKCVFWVCCVYLAMYKKLPDAIVQRLEFQKELSAIEWPDIQLTIEEKQEANSLMGTALDSLALDIDGESLQNEETLRAAHLFCVNHVKCVAVLEDLECSKNLLEKYTKLYPSCLELVLMSAWTEHEVGSNDENFVGFEKALSNWLEDVPGIQCIWNQYAESALQSGRFDFAKELMERWFNSVWKVQYSQSGTIDTIDDESFWSSPRPASSSDPLASQNIFSNTDVVFGLLNFSLYKILHNDHNSAQLALDRALKATTAENYNHCVREHALFSLARCSPHNIDARVGNALKILSGYLVDSRASLGSEPLSRSYIRKIQKPRIQSLVSKLLNPSSDFSLVNSVLEVWYGPSLLPQTNDKLSDTVEFVEAITGILPSNYQLAISACKFVIQSSKTTKLPANISFWASSLVVNALFQAVPIAPEPVWLEVADMLHSLTDLNAVFESFHKRALLVYPFSIKLWKSYLSLFGDTSNITLVKESARERGINLD